jgi:hypothetical protein
MNREVIKILGDIIKESMSLSDQQIWLENEDYKIKETSGLFIIIQQTNSNSYSNTNKFEEDAGQTTLQENITSLTREEYLINIMSKDNEARTRKEELILALNSYTSQDLQSKYNFKISQIGNINNLSELEGSGMLTRYGLSIVCLARYSLTRDVPYYENFSEEVKTN